MKIDFFVLFSYSSLSHKTKKKQQLYLISRSKSAENEEKHENELSSSLKDALDIARDDGLQLLKKTTSASVDNEENSTDNDDNDSEDSNNNDNQNQEDTKQPEQNNTNSTASGNNSKPIAVAKTDDAKNIANQKSAKTKSQKSTKSNVEVPSQFKRGQKTRFNKMKNKYKDQDDEDRELNMQYLGVIYFLLEKKKNEL
jgi:hypothetical protein